MHRTSLLTHNWLALRISNSNVRKHAPQMRGTVYDLGCGTRPYEQDILSFADRYIGVDWSNSPHELKADVAADLNEPLPIPDGVADTVVSFQVLEHLREPKMMLKEAYRIMKPGGRIFIAVPFQWRIHESPHDYFRYTRFGLKYLMESVGFVDVEVAETTGFWSMWLLKLNYQTARLVRGPRPLRVLIRALLVPFWFVNQSAAPMMDRLFRDRHETAGYFAWGTRS